MALHPEVKERLAEIDRVEMETQEPGVRIIDKRGPLNNFADRDHCLQYMAAIGLIFGELTADHYQDNIAADPRIDELREKMVVSENTRFTKDYYDLDKRAIGNSMQIFFSDGSNTEKVEIHYPIGHRNRREEGIPVLQQKFIAATQGHFAADESRPILSAVEDQTQLQQMPVSEFMDLVSRSSATADSLLA